MCNYAKDLIVYFDDDNYNSEDLLESLRPLLKDIKSYKLKATSLKNQLESVKNSLSEIVKGIPEYDAEITKEREDLSKLIVKVNETKNTALSYAKGGYIAAGVGVTAAIVAAPFTGGTSLAVVCAAEAIVDLGALAVLGG
jgi:hypothetical protein